MVNNFLLKNWLFGVTNIVNNSDQSKYLYSGYGIAFDGVLGISLVENVLIFGNNNSSLSFADNC